MKFPNYWSRAYNDSGLVVARGWSETSSEDAHQNAERRLARILSALRAGHEPDEYQYVADGVICEQVIDRVFHGSDEVAVISRNVYGSLVMNTTRMMFVDIDTPQLGMLVRLKNWLTRNKPASPDASVTTQFRQWQKRNPHFTLRVYRTYAGFRLIIQNRCFELVDDAALKILAELKSDRLYRRLCQQQQCFRARLTPKPWRIGLLRPPEAFPFRNEQAAQEVENWFKQYEEASKAYSVCQYVETIGEGMQHPTLSSLIAQHDSFCCRDRPLA